MCSKSLFLRVVKFSVLCDKGLIHDPVLTVSQMTNCSFFQTDDKFKFLENGKKFFKRIENTLGKGEIAPYEQFLLFPQFFQKICTAYM